ncbi:MAG: hydrogenase nickel incorporation protein HypB [Candidatus Alcyoniella australis]|nr:hydrogenase nickel incorporation protein HypB [Candidatus Alcyoniella australis]
MTVKVIDLREPILKQNVADAQQLAARFARSGVFVLNLMSSPGAGKTSLVVQTLKRLPAQIRTAVIEGDVTSKIDAERVEAAGGRALQINTHGACHLDAAMLGRAVDQLELDELDLLIVENVGNLVCPAEFQLGENCRGMVLSVAEGHDKPLKYPLMFTQTEVLALNKIDLLPYTDFDVSACREAVLALNPKMEIFELSCRKQQGLELWIEWLTQRIKSAS